jgi:TRAP-type mannitol/chloroaromatic compound transport system substrate-binding protein
MDRRQLLAATAAAATLATPHLANAQPRLTWRSAGSFPKSLDTLWGNHEFICRRVAELTDGNFQMRPFAPGEIVPALQVLDAVGAGTVECGYTAGTYYVGKDPSMAFSTALPFGLNTRQTWSWLHQAGGRELLLPVQRDQGVHFLTAGTTGAQMGGWFRKEIRTVEDLRGLKFRIAGIAGQVFQKVGAVAQQIGGPDIYPALERGVIDGAEWSGPYDDEKFGFSRIAKFYYYPGWWEPGPAQDYIINLRHWEQLPPQYKAALEAACAEGYCHLGGRYDALNPPAMKRLLVQGTQLRVFPREVMSAFYRAANELYAEIGSSNPRFRQIYEHFDRFRADEQAWFRVAEDSFGIAMAQLAQQQPR